MTWILSLLKLDLFISNFFFFPWCYGVKNWRISIFSPSLSSFHNNIHDKADLEGKWNIISLLMVVYFNNLVSNDAMKYIYSFVNSLENLVGLGTNAK